MVIGFVIWSIVALAFVAIAISTYRAEEAVGFFTFVKPPVVKDIKKYNKAVSVLWLVFAIALEVIGIPFLFLKQNSPLFCVMIIGVVALVIGLMIAYVRLEAKEKI